MGISSFTEMSKVNKLSGLPGFRRINLGDVILLILSEAKMEALRLFIIMYLLRNHLGVSYEYPPWYSSDVWDSLRVLINDGLVDRYSGDKGITMITITERGISRVNSLVKELGDSMVIVGPALIMRASDLRLRVREITRTYVNMPLRALASVALSDAAHERYYLGDRSIASKMLWEASSIL
ncbi:MAG: hypothetical protein ACP5L1_01605 [Caldivirga sp.]|uniref:hypothetical protein n=1 Tax=Caldivirga sp. TaxID=2080243 RepID=UPI003D0AB696